MCYCGFSYWETCEDPAPAPDNARVFEERRSATPEELARLYDSWGIPSMNDQLATAEVSELATLDDLGAAQTVLTNPTPGPGEERIHTVAQLHASWFAGGGDPVRDKLPYEHFVMIALADPTFAPELLFEPAPTSSGWWLVDAVHRATALYSARVAAGVTMLHLSVFVLPRQLR
jgi:hypothetical protein